MVLYRILEKGCCCTILAFICIRLDKIQDECKLIYLSNFNVRDKWNTNAGLVLCVRRTELWVQFSVSLLYLPDSGSHCVKKIMFSNKARYLMLRKMSKIWVTSCVVGEHQRGNPPMNVWCRLYSHRFGPFFFLCWEDGEVHVLNAASLYRLRNNSGQYYLKTRIAAAIQTVDEGMLQQMWRHVRYIVWFTERCSCWMCWKLHFVSQMTLTLCVHPVYTFGFHFRDNLCWNNFKCQLDVTR